MSDDLHDDPEQMRLDDNIVAALRDPSPIDEVARRRAVRAAVATRHGGARWMRPLSAAAAVVVVALAGVVLVQGGDDVDMVSAPAATTRTATNTERAVADMAAESSAELESSAATDGGATAEMAGDEFDDADITTDDADAAASALVAGEQPASTAVAAAEVPEEAVAEPTDTGDDAPMSVLPLIVIDTIEDLAAAGRVALDTDDTVMTDCAARGERAFTFAIVTGVDAVLVIADDASTVRAVSAESCDVILSASITP